MLNIIERFTRPSPSSVDALELLSTVRPECIADPAALRAIKDRLDRQITEADAEWERLDHGDSAAHLRLTPVAMRLQELRAQAEPLPDQIAWAERRRAAFLTLCARFEEVRDDVHARLCGLLEHPPEESGARVAQLRALDRATALHRRLAARLERVSRDRRFREPPDAVRTLHDALEARIRELDRLRVPGTKPVVEWPAGLLELLKIVERKEDLA